MKTAPAFLPAEHSDKTLLIACGALAREVMALISLNEWNGFAISCLPASLHNTPAKIPDAVREKIRGAKPHYKNIFVLYGDCGTGGKLDAVLREEGVERIKGPHCYAFLSGNDDFTRHSDHDVTSYFLTDFLARHFDTFVWKGLGMDRHPELIELYFGNYQRIVYIAQTDNPDLQAKAEEIARRLNLEYEYRFTGYGDLSAAMAGDTRSHQPRIG